jgi:PAS domain S-box-containing protein
MKKTVIPTNVEVFFREEDMIVSKTDLKGRLTYVNREFCRIASYSETELLGQPHSIIRHPDMPRAVFKLLWDSILDGREIFAYVKNMTKRGDYYWVFAHVTPSYDGNGKIVGYHSNRRVPDRDVIGNTIEALYSEMLNEESRHSNGKQALAAGFEYLAGWLKSKGKRYDELMFSA